MFPMYCDLGKECKIPFKRFVTLSVTTLRPQYVHFNCQVQLCQYVLGVLHFTEFGGGRVGCGGSSRSISSSSYIKIQDILLPKSCLAKTRGCEVAA